MKARYFIAIALSAALSLNFILAEPEIRWSGPFPTVGFRINPSISGLHIGTDEDIQQAVQTAALAWSFKNGQSHFNLSAGQFTDQSTVTTPTNIDCSDETYSELYKENAVFADSEVNPDCTGTACTFVWRCSSSEGPIHFDTVLNNSDRSFSTGNTPYPNEYDLATVLAHEFGFVVGLGYCPPGSTQEQCEARIGSTESRPPESSIMYPFLRPGVIKVALDPDDRAGLVSIYGALNESEQQARAEMISFQKKVDSLCNVNPCLLPDQETNPQYQLLPSEEQELDENDDLLAANGFAEPEHRFDQAKLFERLYITAYRDNHDSAERWMINAIEHREAIAHRMADDQLEAARHAITITIKQRKLVLDEFGPELDAGYVAFARAELKSLILIRRAIIDEAATR